MTDACVHIGAFVHKRNEDAMARYSEHGTNRIYQAVDDFRANYLLGSGLLLFNEASWRIELYIQSLCRNF